MIEAVEAVKLFDVEAPKRIAAGQGVAAQIRELSYQLSHSTTGPILSGRKSGLRPEFSSTGSAEAARER